MSWDIYGNKLRRGYCEVHPHVAEEYPCSLCDIDHKKMNMENISMQRAEVEYNRSILRVYLSDEAKGLLQNWKPKDNLDFEAKNRIIDILEQIKK